MRCADHAGRDARDRIARRDVTLTCARLPNLTPPHPAADEADQSRPPTLLDKKMLSQNIYNISSEDLGRVVQLLDQRCDAAIKKIDPEDIEIDIDAIDNATFWAVDGFVKDSLPGAKRGGGGVKKAPAKAAAPAEPKAKKARM